MQNNLEQPIKTAQRKSNDNKTISITIYSDLRYSNATANERICTFEQRLAIKISAEN